MGGLLATEGLCLEKSWSEGLCLEKSLDEVVCLKNSSSETDGKMKHDVYVIG